jgi:hypothetical protein
LSRGASGPSSLSPASKRCAIASNVEVIM